MFNKPKTKTMTDLIKLEKKNLTGINLKNYKLDKSIIKNENSANKLTKIKFAEKRGVSKIKIAGRKTSLIKRGHLLKANKEVVINSVANDALNNTHLEVYELYQNGTKVFELAKKYNTSKVTIYSWIGKMKSIKKVKQPKNTYTNCDGANKEVARNKMTKYIVDSGVEGIVPTLPHIACTIEKKILTDQPNLSFIGVERDLETYKELRKTIKRENLPIVPYNGDLSDKIYGKCEDTYAHVIADYCGMLPTFSKEIEYLIQNKVVKRGGIIAITFGKPLRGSDAQTEFIKSLGGTITNNPKDNRCLSDKSVEAYFNRIIGDEFNFVEIFNYKDTKKDANGSGYPMTLIILQRKKDRLLQQWAGYEQFSK